MLSVAEKVKEIRMIYWLHLSLADLKVLMTETSAHLAKVANDETDSNRARRHEFILVTLADVGLGYLKSMFAIVVSASDTQWLFDSVGENKHPIITRYVILFCKKLNGLINAMTISNRSILSILSSLDGTFLLTPLSRRAMIMSATM